MGAARRAVARAILWTAVGLAGAVLGSCGGRSIGEASPEPVEASERVFAHTRALWDAIDVTRSRGASVSTDGIAIDKLTRAYARARDALQRSLARAANPPASPEDGRALLAMRDALERYLPEASGEPTSGDAESGGPQLGGCEYDAEVVAAAGDLAERMYGCFGAAASSLSFEGESLDRLTVFGRLPLTDDPARREGLWRAMRPIWESVNGDNGPGSPYRTLVRRNAERMKRDGEVLGESVRGIGVEPDVMETWLTAVLQKWREITPEKSIEPWDFAYEAGRGSRALERAAPLASLRSINDRFYRDLGADPLALQVQYDLEPRPEKDPVAFTTFGRRARFDGQRWTPAQPWVFASYQMGGISNLLELLHETGHAIHVAAIRTRPAFNDWPDSDIFTEGIADIATLEMYESAWQQRYLGASIPIRDAIIAKYAWIAMDIAWALFEVRMYREPERDPNQVWSEICERYFRIAPHPDLAWWAVRGQLIDAPGYMMNYAAGAILNADLRARLRERYGSYVGGDPGWYQRVSEDLYRFGLEKASKQVVEDFLGRPVSPQALLDDMSRAVEPAR